MWTEKWYFRTFWTHFLVQILIFGRSPPTPNFNGFTTKIPEMHVCAAHDCGRSWHVHRHPISASCSSRQSDKSWTDNKKVNRAFRSCARRKFTGALKHLVSRVIKIWAKNLFESQITVKNSVWLLSELWRLYIGTDRYLSVPINVKVPIKVIEKMGFLDLLNTFFGSNS